MQYGYNPDLKYHNGKYFPARPDNYELTSLKSYTVEDVKMIEKRIKDAIDSGYVIGVSTGSRVETLYAVAKCRR